MEKINYVACMGVDNMILKNAMIFNDEFELIRADIQTEGDRIARISHQIDGQTNGEEEFDMRGCMILPGFVDIHIHGCVGADTMDGTRNSIANMASHLVQKGVTSFCPTTMAGSFLQIDAALAAVRNCMDSPPKGASVLGAHMEGPYLSHEKKGAQLEEALREPDFEEFISFYQKCKGAIRLVDVSPEYENAEEFITRASKLCTVSIAHSNADYDIAMEAFRLGCTHVSHLFNAMTGLQHRNPGIVGAVFDSPGVRAELICDGVHIHPAVLRTAFLLLGDNRGIIVSDSMRGAGLKDGESELGGQKVFNRNGIAVLEDGTLAGSTTNMLNEVRNLVQFGIPLKQVIRSATINPASAIGMDGEIGSIQEGKRADFVILDEELCMKMVVVRGIKACEEPEAEH